MRMNDSTLVDGSLNAEVDKTPRKRGLCWSAESQADVHDFTKGRSKISWLCSYSDNWTPRAGLDNHNLEFVPMQCSDESSDCLSDAMKGNNARTIVAYNEPEAVKHANMSPELAAKDWMLHIEPLRCAGYRCGSPSISNTDIGVSWLQNFLAAIRADGGDVDFLCLHWYGPNKGAFYDYIWSVRRRLDPSKTIWITEFATTNWDELDPLPREHVEDFVRRSVDYLDSLDWIERYCWYGPVREPGKVGHWARMLDDDGKLTPLGKIYRDQ